VNVIGRRARWPTRVIALAAGALLIAGCGTKPATSDPSVHAPVPALGGATLATSASNASGTDWAVVKMGGSADPLDNFWELFVRPAGSASWRLATPAGVASNGGLVMAATGTTSLVAGFLPSQMLTFSPLAATSDGGANWSQSALLKPGFSDVPYALGAGSGGQLLALTDTGDVDASTNAGASWRTITTRRALAASPAARACGIDALTAVAWTPTGSPLVAARCDQPDATGIFILAAGGWRRAGLPLPGNLSRDAVDVIGLATNGQRMTVVLAAKSATRTTMLAGWSTDGGASWRLSPELAAGTATGPSVSIWADGSVGLVLPGSTAASATTGATIGWQSPEWRTLPQLPARTATLAAGPDGQPQALAVSGVAFTAWQLAAGSNRWTVTQTVHVPVPYGSSG
jgi:hypothetical protein